MIKQALGSVLRHLITDLENHAPLSGIPISKQFCPEEKGPLPTLRNLNAAFLIRLCGETHARYQEARQYMEDPAERPGGPSARSFYTRALRMIPSEVEAACARHPELQRALAGLPKWMGEPAHLENRNETVNRIWRVFFPEGVSLLDSRENKIRSLRERRLVRITRPNPDPIRDPAREILFTSNVLLTLPHPSAEGEGGTLSMELRRRLERIRREPQAYWYDHPVQMGVPPERNEVVYGLRGLNKAMDFEKRRGSVAGAAKMTCVLSVSVTHEGLRPVARAYLRDLLAEAGGLEHLRVYLFTESDAGRVLKEVLAPAARHYLGPDGAEVLDQIFGVDGEYGRHYSFLKSIAALWHVLVDPEIRATFKIDLDQIFPQEALVRETGASALEHLRTPLWGAEGTDRYGSPVELGLIAGALVNEGDMTRGLFTPDVAYPSGNIQADECVFFSRLTQALSTQAEMMARYGEKPLDGIRQCLQRVHVTGGTCGILVESLRRHRPFTPSFIGRAEDQAYLLSVLKEGAGPFLRYVHKGGLIMRHDKEAFAGEAIRAASVGKEIGDFVRILLFSHYARALPWPLEETKREIDPFTGCFVSRMPMTLVCLRLALRGAGYFEKGAGEDAGAFLNLGARRLEPIMARIANDPGVLRHTYLRERSGWDNYYDSLEKLEQGLRAGEPFAGMMKQKAGEIVQGCRAV
jgi:hypothetical protein